MIEPLINAIIDGDVEKTIDLTNICLEKDYKAKVIIDQALIPAMSIVGDRFTKEQIFLPEMLIAAQSAEAAIKILEPLLTNSEKLKNTKFIIGTVEGDLHDIGKNLVSVMLKGAGYEVIDLGINVPAEKFIEALNEHKAPFLGLSALLTSTMNKMEETISAITSAGIRDKVKILVGGAPVNDRFAKSIGADGYAPDAGSTVELVNNLKNEFNL